MRPLPRPPGARHGLTRCAKGSFTCRRPPLSAMPSAGEGSLTCRAASRSAARAVLSPRLHAAAHPQRARRRPGGRAGGARRADAVTGHRRIGCRLPAPRRTHRASALPVLRQRTDARGGKPSAGAPSPSPARPPMIAAPCSPRIRLPGAPACARGGTRPDPGTAQRSVLSIPTAVRKGLCRDIGWPAWDARKSARVMPKD